MKYKKIKIIKPKPEQPEEGVMTIDSSQLVEVRENGCHFALRNSGELKYKAVFLGDTIDNKYVKWVIVEDSGGTLCAVPFTRKE